MIAPLIAEETLNNKLSMHSVDDRIEGFARAIVAAGAQRMSARQAPLPRTRWN